MEKKPGVIVDEEELLRIRKESQSEYHKIDKEQRKTRKIIILCVFSIMFITVLLIKLTIGTIEIYNPFGYPNSRVRYYNVVFNDNKIHVGINTKKETKIIPGLVSLTSYTIGNSYPKENSDYEPHADDSSKYVFSIESYSCFYGGHQMECIKEMNDMKKNNDTKYNKMVITRTSNPYEVVYEGSLTNDITKYVEKNGVYAIQIFATYGNVTDEVYFYFTR